jgi:hypothetical protein
MSNIYRFENLVGLIRSALILRGNLKLESETKAFPSDEQIQYEIDLLLNNKDGKFSIETSADERMKVFLETKDRLGRIKEAFDNTEIEMKKLEEKEAKKAARKAAKKK